MVLAAKPEEQITYRLDCRTHIYTYSQTLSYLFKTVNIIALKSTDKNKNSHT